MRKRPQRGIIVAVNRHWVIGQDNKIPWHYPEDMKRFRRLTLHTAVVMGRKTFESMGCKPLKDRWNYVVSSTMETTPDVTVVASIEDAVGLVADERPIWFIGGTRIYEAALAIADVVEMTHVPFDTPRADDMGVVGFPEMSFSFAWSAEDFDHPDPVLRIERYTRRAASFEPSYDDPYNRKLQWQGVMPRSK